MTCMTRALIGTLGCVALPALVSADPIRIVEA
jgi:hypothetical protein